ncbi:hypothetical protein DSO57_1018825 [Entomophthora muscae]|uniref:Uncharacterized protein n=1 Tax=Entomophthora muscae TaxID=34485 RepID=A0ACC2TEX7_9FUNG|nr:hypothetical protein DSO57_1018825 [Entomophthora muscae]
MSNLPPISAIISTAILPPCPCLKRRASEDTLQLSRFKLDFATAPPLPPPSNPRHRMSPSQTNMLDLAFQTCRFPSRDAREYLASLLNTSPRRIQVWFQNKRQKLRSQHFPLL